MIIHRAILRYGYSNFKLEIMEYCDKENLLIREQHYLDSLKPEYNTCKIAGSQLGLIRSKETRIRISAAKLGISLSEETRFRMSAAKLGISLSEDTRRRMSEAKKGMTKIEGSGSPSVSIEVLDLETGIKTIYPSMSEVARALGIPKMRISQYLSRNQQKPYKNKYRFYYF
jgi:group I intron endonuclease